MDLKRGDKVVVSMGAPCGHCAYCGDGHMEFCNGNPRRATFGEMDDSTYRLSHKGETIHSFVGIGSLGEYAVVRRRKLVKFEQDIPFESACLISCGVTPGIGAVFNTAKVTPGSSVLVFGCGGVGLSIIQAALISGASTIIAVDNNSAKLDLASNFGASHCLLSPQGPDELDAAVRAIIPRDVNFAFDAVGTRKERLSELMRVIDKGGVTVAVGVLPWTETVPVLAGDLLFSSRKLTRTVGGNTVPSRDIPRILKLYQNKRLKLDELVGAAFGLDEIASAFDAATKAQHGRTVVRMAPQLL